jgi:hypothetical protein
VKYKQYTFQIMKLFQSSILKVPASYILRAVWTRSTDVGEDL